VKALEAEKLELGEAEVHGFGDVVLDGEGETLALAVSAVEGEPVREMTALTERLAVEEEEAHVDAETDAHAETRADAVGEPVL
jgi:hypothetical protein